MLSHGFSRKSAPLASVTPLFAVSTESNGRWHFPRNVRVRSACLSFLARSNEVAGPDLAHGPRVWSVHHRKKKNTPHTLDYHGLLILLSWDNTADFVVIAAQLTCTCGFIWGSGGVLAFSLQLSCEGSSILKPGNHVKKWNSLNRIIVLLWKTADQTVCLPRKKKPLDRTEKRGITSWDIQMGGETVCEALGCLPVAPGVSFQFVWLFTKTSEVMINRRKHEAVLMFIYLLVTLVVLVLLLTLTT